LSQGLPGTAVKDSSICFLLSCPTAQLHPLAVFHARRDPVCRQSCSSACDSCQLGQVTCYCQGGSKQLHLFQHTYRPDYLDRHLSRSHACRERERERPVELSKERRRSPARRASPSPQQRAPPPERKYAPSSSVVLTPFSVNGTYFAVATCNRKPGQESSKHSRPSFALFI